MLPEVPRTWTVVKVLLRVWKVDADASLGGLVPAANEFECPAGIGKSDWQGSVCCYCFVEGSELTAES